MVYSWKLLLPTSHPSSWYINPAVKRKYREIVLYSWRNLLPIPFFYLLTHSNLVIKRKYRGAVLYSWKLIVSVSHLLIVNNKRLYVEILNRNSRGNKEEQLYSEICQEEQSCTLENPFKLSSSRLLTGQRYFNPGVKRKVRGTVMYSWKPFQTPLHRTSWCHRSILIQESRGNKEAHQE